MSTSLPHLNARVKAVVDYYAQGNVSKFVRLLEEGGEKISQQRFNRIFHIEPKTNKYPSVPTSVTTAITNVFKKVNSTWLLTGQGEMLVDAGKPAPGDPLNPTRAQLLSLIFHFSNFKAGQTGENPIEIVKGIFGTSTTILSRLDNWKPGDQLEDLFDGL